MNRNIIFSDLFSIYPETVGHLNLETSIFYRYTACF